MVDIGLPHSLVIYLCTAAIKNIKDGSKIMCQRMLVLKNFHHMFEWVLKFSNIKEILHSNVLRRNTFFAHHANILLAMLANDSKIIEFGCHKSSICIESMKLREVSTSFAAVRKFITPTIYRKTDAYHKLINLQDCNQQLAICSTCDNDINAIKTPKLVVLHPCYNRDGKRHIKIVMETSTLATEFKEKPNSSKKNSQKS